MKYVGKRIISTVCALALLAAMLPAQVLAAEGNASAAPADSVVLTDTTAGQGAESGADPAGAPEEGSVEDQEKDTDQEGQESAEKQDPAENAGAASETTQEEKDPAEDTQPQEPETDLQEPDADSEGGETQPEEEPGQEAPSKAPAVDNSLMAPLVEGDVAKIGDTTYATLDEAVAAAAEGATIELLQDATTEGLNLSKDLTIQAAEGVTEKPTVTFAKYGIALWGKALTFKNLNVVMTGIGSTPYTAEWKWMAICASKNASLTLDNTSMTMDGTGTVSNTHAIYFCSNNVLNIVNGSNLTIKNYPHNALEWDGGDGGYNVNITDSTFVSDHNRSGFTGTFYATISNSKVDVINSSGNGSNGSHYIIKDNSTVNFSNNGSHGLSAGNLTIQDSTVTCLNNGMTGIIFTGTGKFINSDITISGTKGTSYWNAGLRLYTDRARLTVDKDTKLSIQNNFVTGIFMDASTRMTIEEGADVLVTGNEAKQKYCSTPKDTAKRGGGLTIRSGAAAELSASTQIYNNHAALSGDDIYLEGSASLTFHPVGSEWQLNECEHPIDGWYYDESESRWNVHNAGNYSATLFENFANGTAVVTGAVSLKAAHSEVATLQPADITIYMGGDAGYEGVAEADGSITGSNSLPEPGYYITLPDKVNEALQAAGRVDADNTPVNLSDLITICTVGAEEQHDWQLQKYGNTYSAALGKYIYAITPVGETNPLRLTFTDGDTVIDQDSFILSAEQTLQTEYDMDIYSELVDARQVFLKVTIPGQEPYYCNVDTAPGKLNVRYVTGSQDSVVTPAYDSIEEASAADDPDKKALDKAYLIRDQDTKFYINASDVDVTESENLAHVSLLFDDIVSGENTEGMADYKTLLTKKAKEMVSPRLENVQTQAKYLDLVDANNGNVWLTTHEAVTVYWPYPEGTDENTNFRLVHFDGLDRNMPVSEVAGDINDAEPVVVDISKDAYGISFQTTSFSPYVLIWGDLPATETPSEETPAATPAPTATPAPAVTPAPTAAAPAVIPQTGDAMPIELLVGILIVAALVFVGLLILRKRRGK